MKTILNEYCPVMAVMRMMLLACICYSSPGTAGVTAEDEDFESFTRYYGHLRREIARLAKAPAQAEAMERDAVRLLGVTIDEFRAMGRMFEGVRRDLNALDSEGRTYVQKELARGGKPDVRTLEGYEERRHKILSSARIASSGNCPRIRGSLLTTSYAIGPQESVKVCNSQFTLGAGGSRVCDDRRYRPLHRGAGSTARTAPVGELLLLPSDCCPASLSSPAWATPA